MNEHSEVFMIMGRSGIELPQFNVHRCYQELWANSAESKSLSSTQLTTTPPARGPYRVEIEPSNYPRALEQHAREWVPIREDDPVI